MTTKLVRIGNSKGVILGKSFIDHAQLEDEVIIELSSEGILIKSSKSSKRKDWDKKFKSVKRKDKLILGSWGNEFDKTEWEWK